MIHLPASVRVYLCLTPCDMRKSFDSLQALVREHLERTPSPGTCLYSPAGARTGSRFCTGTATVSPYGASAWRKGRTQFHLATAEQNADVRSRRRSWERC